MDHWLPVTDVEYTPTWIVYFPILRQVKAARYVNLGGGGGVSKVIVNRSRYNNSEFTKGHRSGYS